jgi:hypothetical protein
MSKVIKELRASHRLILSGTPIQVRLLSSRFHKALSNTVDFKMYFFLEQRVRTVVII